MLGRMAYLRQATRRAHSGMSATTRQIALELINERAALRAGATANRHGDSESAQDINDGLCLTTNSVIDGVLRLLC
jgi:hypothetical protein